MKEMVSSKAELITDDNDEHADKSVQISTSMICRNRKILSISSFFSKLKTYKFTVDKRVMAEDYQTIPFGY